MSRKSTTWLALLAVPALALTGCASSNDGEASGEGGDITLSLAHSYTDDQPQHRCGAQLIKEEVEAANVGLTIEIFGNSQLGGDADRIASVASGDVDMDLQGASALGAVYEPISVMDAAYAFDNAEHLAKFMDSDDSNKLMEDFESSTGIHVLDAWSAGARHFTANTEINTPEDLEGLKMRFPGSPQFLLNADAMGATPTEVAYEEIFLALQQGTVDGQENPITNIDSLNLQEVQSHLNLSAHQLNTNLILIGEKWNQLDEEQQKVLTEATANAVTEVTKCVEEYEAETIDAWKTGGEWEVNENVDVDAFREKASKFFENELEGDSLEAYNAIRAAA